MQTKYRIKLQEVEISATQGYADTSMTQNLLVLLSELQQAIAISDTWITTYNLRLSTLQPTKTNAACQL